MEERSHPDTFAWLPIPEPAWATRPFPRGASLTRSLFLAWVAGIGLRERVIWMLLGGWSLFLAWVAGIGLRERVSESLNAWPAGSLG